MGEFNSDDHYIYYCGKESLRTNGVAIMVNKRVCNAKLGCSLKNNRMISVRFQGKPFNITVIQVYAPTSNAEEAEFEQFHENPVELFQILKDDAVKVLHSICQQIWKTQQWPQDWKRSVFIPIPKKGSIKECSDYHTIALISQTSKVMLKILQPRLQQYMNHELPDLRAGFRKSRGTRDQMANILWIIEKAMEFQKNIYLLFY